MNEKIRNAKNFVKRNERRILVTTAAVATTIAVLQHNGIKSLNEFLKEHDLFDEYYQMDEE